MSRLDEIRERWAPANVDVTRCATGPTPGWPRMVSAFRTVAELLRHAPEDIAYLLGEINGLHGDVEKWREKAQCYGDMVHGCGPALEPAGHPVDSRPPGGGVEGVRKSVEALVAERDRDRERLDWLLGELDQHEDVDDGRPNDCNRILAEYERRFGEVDR